MNKGSEGLHETHRDTQRYRGTHRDSRGRGGHTGTQGHTEIAETQGHTETAETHRGTHRDTEGNRDTRGHTETQEHTGTHRCHHHRVPALQEDDVSVDIQRMHISLPVACSHTE